MDRIKFVHGLFLIAIILILGRLVYWQFFSTYARQAQDILKESEIPASRGEIYASDGFPLVANQEAYLVFANPSGLAQNPKEVAKALAPYLISEKFATQSAQLSEGEQKLKEEEIKKKEADLAVKLESKNLVWIQLARKVPRDIKEKIEKLTISGIGFEKDEKRLYPEASMAAQLLGFVGFDKFGRDVGYFGIEGFWDRILKGKSGRLGQEKDPFGLPILVGKYRPIPPKKGSALYLSIDRTIQFIVEKKLAQATEKYGAREGTVIIADPKRGQILAMTTYPGYDPSLRLEYEENLYRNPAVADTFEPGSIFKLVTMSAALETGAVQPSTRCPCQGSVQIAGFEISTWNKKYHPDSTMTEIIQNSDNVGMTFVAQRLKVERLYEFINRFGFGKLTGIDLQEEAPGFVRLKDQWREIDLATASFGQGIAVTPIQMVQAVTTIANGGKLIPPRIAVKIISEKKEEEAESDQERQVISAKTASQITEMMVNAVAKGEARAFAPKGYRIAGKTGTAQIPVAGHYDPNKTIASFVGFAPADDPRFVMFVRFSQPSTSPYGSETAAPTLFEIAKELFVYFGIPPSE